MVKELVCRLHLGGAPSRMAQRAAQLDALEPGLVDLLVFQRQLPLIGLICMSSGTMIMKSCLS